jgi:hypothetical protein
MPILLSRARQQAVFSDFHDGLLVVRFAHLVTILRRRSVYFQQNGLADLA